MRNETMHSRYKKAIDQAHLTHRTSAGSDNKRNISSTADDEMVSSHMARTKIRVRQKSTIWCYSDWKQLFELSQNTLILNQHFPWFLLLIYIFHSS